MATFLFWNINKKPLQDHIVALCHEHDVDILILAESDLPAVPLLQALNTEQRSTFRQPFNLSDRLFFLIRYPTDWLKPVRDDGGVAIRHFIPPIGPDILLAAVHLPSKLYGNESDQIFEANRAAQMVTEAEERVGHTRTVIVGDFNMNPFEPGMVGTRGFQAVMDQRIARRINRTVLGKEYSFFYNPMWSRLGDLSKGPPGTYYYNSSTHVNFFWNTFDQVLIRPDLLDLFSADRFQVLDVAGQQSLLSSNGLPDSSLNSDHLPLLFNIEIERVI